MKDLLYIFIGGGTGSILRYLCTVLINSRHTTFFPWGTFCVNIIGCILIGFFYTITSKIPVSNEVRMMLTIGICGGFTTFSTFCNESLGLLKDGHYLVFLSYAAGSFIIGLLGIVFGIWISD